MWLFFRDDGFGAHPEKFSRLITTFARHDQKFNAAVSPAALSENSLRHNIPYSYQAAPYLQFATHGHFKGPTSAFAEAVPHFQASLENYFPCFVFCDETVPPSDLGDHLPEWGYRMISSRETVPAPPCSLPRFDTCLPLHEHSARGAKQIFLQLAERKERGLDHSGISLRHARMQDEDFEVLDQLLRELSKRSIPTSFFSEMLPGGERRRGIELGHV